MLEKSIIELSLLKIKLLSTDNPEVSNILIKKFRKWSSVLYTRYSTFSEDDKNKYFNKVRELIQDANDFLTVYTPYVDKFSKQYDTDRDHEGTGSTLDSRKILQLIAECKQNTTANLHSNANRQGTKDLECKNPVSSAKSVHLATDTGYIQKTRECTDRDNIATKSRLECKCTCNQAINFDLSTVHHREHNNVYTDQDWVKIWYVSTKSQSVEVKTISKELCTERKFNSMLQPMITSHGREKNNPMSFNMKICCNSYYTILFLKENRCYRKNNTMAKLIKGIHYLGTPDNIRGNYIIYKQVITEQGFLVKDMDISPKEFNKIAKEY